MSTTTLSSSENLPPVFHKPTILPITTSDKTNLPAREKQTTTTNYPNTKPTQTFLNKMRHSHNTHTTTTSKPTLMTRLRGRRANKRTVKTTTVTEPGHGHTTTARRSRWGGRRSNRTTVAPVHHKRHVSLGDKISGAMMKLKGSLMHRPGVKVCISWLDLILGPKLNCPPRLQAQGECMEPTDAEAIVFIRVIERARMAENYVRYFCFYTQMI